MTDTRDVTEGSVTLGNAIGVHGSGDHGDGKHGRVSCKARVASGVCASHRGVTRSVPGAVVDAGLRLIALTKKGRAKRPQANSQGLGLARVASRSRHSFIESLVHVQLLSASDHVTGISHPLSLLSKHKNPKGCCSLVAVVVQVQIERDWRAQGIFVLVLITRSERDGG
jgi:hypothetical protein